MERQNAFEKWFNKIQHALFLLFRKAKLLNHADYVIWRKKKDLILQLDKIKKLEGIIDIFDLPFCFNSLTPVLSGTGSYQNVRKSTYNKES